MGAKTGLAILGAYLNDGTDLNVFRALIPDPDVSPAQAGGVKTGGGGFLDEMSPGAAAQIHVEIDAMTAAGVAFRVGTYTATAGDGVATLLNIVTGLADITINNCIIAIKRAGVNVMRDATVTEPTPGTIRIANTANYIIAAGDVVTYYAE